MLIAFHDIPSAYSQNVSWCMAEGYSAAVWVQVAWETTLLVFTWTSHSK